MRSLFLPLITLMVLCSCSTPPVWKGVYTAEQAARGQRVYEDHCVQCHRADLSAFNGRLKGKRFMDEWREDTLNSLFIQMKTDMPAENPSTLSDAEYLDVLTYILEKNGFPRGRQELAVESLESIVLVGRDGPKPLPEGAVVQTVGCLKHDVANDKWTLSNALDFTRARRPKESTPEELSGRGTHSVDLNMRLFRLFSGKKVDLTSHNGRIVVIRGRLESVTGTPRVMMLELAGTGSAC